MHLTLTNRDFLIGKVVEPAFYDVVINEVEESLSKAGDSTNWELKAEVLQNADTGDKTNAGVPVPRWAFNSKAGGFVIPLYASIDAYKGITNPPALELNAQRGTGTPALVLSPVSAFCKTSAFNSQLVLSPALERDSSTS